ncbi:MAG: molybdenum cofactor biosynthesis protein B [Nitrospiria bacterium]
MKQQDTRTMILVGILTVSDKGAIGERSDGSGQLLHQLLEPLPAKVTVYKIVPDEKKIIQEQLISFSDDKKVDLILTTGGTGISPRDITPDATQEVIDSLIPGVGEIMRTEGYKKNPRAIISRGIAGVRGRTLIINFPGSPRAVRENYEIILPALAHMIEKIKGTGGDCGSPE